MSALLWTTHPLLVLAIGVSIGVSLTLYVVAAVRLAKGREVRRG